VDAAAGTLTEEALKKATRSLSRSDHATPRKCGDYKINMAKTPTPPARGVHYVSKDAGKLKLRPAAYSRTWLRPCWKILGLPQPADMTSKSLISIRVRKKTGLM